MDHRALLLALVTLTTPATCLAEDAGAPQPERDYSRCGMMRSMPDWCREHQAEQQRERERQRVRVRGEEPHR